MVIRSGPWRCAKTLGRISSRHGRPNGSRGAMTPSKPTFAVFLQTRPAKPSLTRSKKGIADWGLLQVGFFGAFRRSGSVTIEVGRICRGAEGLFGDSAALEKRIYVRAKAGLLGQRAVCPVQCLENLG